MLEVTMRRGREPKRAAMSAAMPGAKVLSLLSQGPKGCVYKVQLEMSGEGTTKIGLMNLDMAMGKGSIIMPREEGEDLPSRKDRLTRAWMTARPGVQKSRSS